MSSHLRQNRERRGQRASRLRKLGYSSYKVYLASSAWAATKARYRSSDQPQDCICGERKGLQIHHKTYERVGEEFMTDLVALCSVCHSMIHTLNRRGDHGLDIDDLVTTPNRDPNLQTRQVSEEEYNEMKRLHAEGVGIHEIAQRLGWRQATVYKWVRRKFYSYP